MHFAWSCFSGGKQSQEMCDLYSAAPNAFVLLRSCISFASPSLSLPFPSSVMLARSLRPLTWCVFISVDQPLWVCRLPPPSGIFSALFFLIYYSLSLLPACFACVGVRLQLCFSQTALRLFYSDKTTWIFLESH